MRGVGEDNAISREPPDNPTASRGLWGCMYRTRQFLLGALLLIEGIASPHIASAAPITVAGFTFAQGELDFADDAVVISGTVTGATAAQVRSTLIGASLRDSIRLITPDVAVVEIAFSDNAIVNGPGTDLVIFELSGSGRPVGYADATERRIQCSRCVRILTLR